MGWIYEIFSSNVFYYLPRVKCRKNELIYLMGRETFHTPKASRMGDGVDHQKEEKNNTEYFTHKHQPNPAQPNP